MLKLEQALAAWGQDDFSAVLKDELQSLKPTQLPLEKGTSQGGYVDDSPISVTVNRFTETDRQLEGSVGVFFTEIVINCGCGNDPMPVNAYCELQVDIDKNTAAANFRII